MRLAQRTEKHDRRKARVNASRVVEHIADIAELLLLAAATSGAIVALSDMMRFRALVRVANRAPRVAVRRVARVVERMRIALRHLVDRRVARTFH